jgi:hypothetical protein
MVWVCLCSIVCISFLLSRWEHEPWRRGAERTLQTRPSQPSVSVPQSQQRATSLTILSTGVCFFFLNSLSAFFATLQMLLKTKALPRKPITTQSTPLTQRRLVLGLLGTAEQTSPAGGNETSLLTSGSLTADGRGLTDMLVVTTTVGVIHGVHGNTTSLGPGVALDGELVLGATGLCGGC